MDKRACRLPYQARFTDLKITEFAWKAHDGQQSD